MLWLDGDCYRCSAGVRRRSVSGKQLLDGAQTLLSKAGHAANGAQSLISKAGQAAKRATPMSRPRSNPDVAAMAAAAEGDK